MSELLEWLTKVLDEQERVALAAKTHTGHWRWDHGFGDMCDEDDCPYGSLLDESSEGGVFQGTVLMEVHGYDIKQPWQGAEHIATNDPAAVLADIAAKRKIVDYMRRQILDATEYYNTDAKEAALSATCAKSTLRALASAYADRPGYDESWRP